MTRVLKSHVILAWLLGKLELIMGVAATKGPRRRVAIIVDAADGDTTEGHGPVAVGADAYRTKMALAVVGKPTTQAIPVAILRGAQARMRIPILTSAVDP